MIAAKAFFVLVVLTLLTLLGLIAGAAMGYVVARLA